MSVGLILSYIITNYNFWGKAFGQTMPKETNLAIKHSATFGGEKTKNKDSKSEQRLHTSYEATYSPSVDCRLTCKYFGVKCENVSPTAKT